MKKRNSPRIPVTHGLKDLYAMDMHLPFQAACSGQFSVVAFGRLAAALSVVRYALEIGQTKFLEAIPTLDASLDTLQAVRQRGDATSVWQITESERPSVLNGIEVAEQCIGTLSVNQLERAADMLLMHINQPPAAR